MCVVTVALVVAIVVTVAVVVVDASEGGVLPIVPRWVVVAVVERGVVVVVVVVESDVVDRGGAEIGYGVVGECAAAAVGVWLGVVEPIAVVVAVEQAVVAVAVVVIVVGAVAVAASCRLRNRVGRPVGLCVRLGRLGLA